MKTKEPKYDVPFLALYDKPFYDVPQFTHVTMRKHVRAHHDNGSIDLKPAWYYSGDVFKTRRDPNGRLCFDPKNSSEILTIGEDDLTPLNELVSVESPV